MALLAGLTRDQVPATWKEATSYHTIKTLGPKKKLVNAVRRADPKEVTVVIMQSD